MKAADLESLTPDELETLARSVQEALEKHRKEKARHVLAEARRLAASVGYEAAFKGRKALAAADGTEEGRAEIPQSRKLVRSVERTRTATGMGSEGIGRRAKP